jgi:membrane-associated phospholipid phosphatase
MTDGAIELPPIPTDMAIARAVERRVTPTEEATLRILTWAADEHVVIGIAALVAGYQRIVADDDRSRRRAEHILFSSIVACAVPHLIKHVVDRKRPDRTVVPPNRKGIPRSGKPWDSFPSGHAVQIGALAAALRRTGPRWLRPFIWPLGIPLAGTRIVLLAHYPTDVLAGLFLGVTVEKAVTTIRRLASPRGSTPIGPGAD